MQQGGRLTATAPTKWAAKTAATHTADGSGAERQPGLRYRGNHGMRPAYGNLRTDHTWKSVHCD